MATHKKETEPSTLKDNILIIMFLFQLYNVIGPLVEKKFNLGTILSESVQNSATASMFIASTFFLAATSKPTTPQRKMAASLAIFLFAVGMLLTLAKSWLEKSAEQF